MIAIVINYSFNLMNSWKRTSEHENQHKETTKGTNQR